MTKSTIKSFVKSFVAVVTGDDATAKGEKVFRQVQSALNTQIATLTGDTIQKEDAVSDATEKLALARVNNGNTISDRNTYVANLLSAKNALTAAEEDLEKHNAKLAFLKAELASLEEEVDA
jgi:chromosome segregation ATPase